MSRTETVGNVWKSPINNDFLTVVKEEKIGVAETSNLYSLFDDESRIMRPAQGGVNKNQNPQNQGARNDQVFFDSLATPSVDASTLQMFAQLAAMRLNNETVSVIQKQIISDMKYQEVCSKYQQEKLQEWIKKYNDLRPWLKAMKIFGIVSKVVLFVLLGPIGYFVSKEVEKLNITEKIFNFVKTEIVKPLLLTLGVPKDQVDAQADFFTAMTLSPVTGGLLNSTIAVKLWSSLLIMNGVDKNKAQIIAMVIVVVITLVVAVAVAFAMPAVLETVAQSIANLARTSVQLIMRFIQIIRKMIAALQAVSKSIQSGLSIGAAFPQRDLVKIKADMSYLEQESDFAAKDVELDQSRMKTIFERYNSNTKTLFQQMLDSQRTGRTIASYV